MGWLVAKLLKKALHLTWLQIIVGNQYYQPFFCFTSHLSGYLPVNRFYLVCKSALLKRSLRCIYIGKIIGNVCIFLKITFPLTVFHTKKFLNRQLLVNIIKYSLRICHMINRWDLQKKVICCGSHLLVVLLCHYFNLLFSKCNF